MAAEFIGYSILVTLHNPAGAQIEGVVSDVINQKLYLRNALLRWSGQRLPSYILDAAAIADLEIATSAQEDELPTPTQSLQQPPQQPSQPTDFVDPAILSYNRNARPPVSPIMIADGAVPSPVRAAGQQTLRGQSSISSIATARNTARKANRRDSSATATLTEPFDALAVKENKQDRSLTETAEKRKSQTGPGIIDLKDVHHVPPKHNKKQPGKGRGWRNTPLIEEKPKSGRKQRGRQAAEDPNGWATEDATDIADMGDFDFEGNHAKFDKRKVFDDIRRDDTTADEERLVSFNRTQARPGINGGRNLHFTENVLDAPDTQDANRWKSEAGETEDEIVPDEHYSSGRNSRRAGSRRPVQSRKASVIPSHLDRKDPSPRPLTRMPTGSPLNGSVSGIRASFRVASNNKPCHAVSPLQMLELEQLCTSELGLTEDMLTENAGRSIAEAILRHSSLAAAAAASPTTTTQAQPQPQPTEPKNILFLLGNHKSAARALSAARHLRNRRLRITVCILGLERGEDQLLEVVRKQLKIYRLSLGHAERWDDYLAKLANGMSMSTAGAGSTGSGGGTSSIQPPDFIVDALLGVHHAFEELRTDDQATVFGMTKWVNLSARKLVGTGRPNVNAIATATSISATLPILSIDVPSGLSATSGISAEADGQPLVMNSTAVVCLGAPKVGLLAYIAGEHGSASCNANDAVGGERWTDRITVSVADVGISLVAWQRNGSRRKQGVDFGGCWVVPVRFVV